MGKWDRHGTAPKHETERVQNFASTLALAFLAQPRVLVLDEATSNVDQKSESRIESALDNLLGGRTAIIIAHRLATARRADRIAVINDKGILEMGSHDELLAQRGYYAGMYATWEQQQGH